MSPYAASKLAGESYVAAFNECFGLKSIAFRFFNVYGLTSELIISMQP